MKILKEQIEFIKNQTLQGLSAKQIAENLGITIGMVEYQRKKNKWNSTYNPNLLDKYLEEIKILVENNVKDKEIAEKYKCNVVTVFNFRKKHNLKRCNLREARTTKISEELYEFLIGTLLGDSSLCCRGISPYYQCEHSIKQQKYLEHKFQLLNKFSPRLFKNFNKNSIGIRTLCNKSFINLYKEFYPKKSKVIPFKLLKHFTARSLAYLFMDDGFGVIGKNHNITTIGISLCAFSENDLIKFIKFLDNTFNLKFTIHHHYNKKYNKKYTELYLKAESFNLFEKLVNPYLMDWAKYKIKRLVTL